MVECSNSVFNFIGAYQFFISAIIEIIKANPAIAFEVIRGDEWWKWRKKKRHTYLQ